MLWLCFLLHVWIAKNWFQGVSPRRRMSAYADGRAARTRQGYRLGTDSIVIRNALVYKTEGGETCWMPPHYNGKGGIHVTNDCP